jgi:hypothetical protein
MFIQQLTVTVLDADNLTELLGKKKDNLTEQGNTFYCSRFPYSLPNRGTRPQDKLLNQ